MLLADKIGLPRGEAMKFFFHFESNGWKVGGKTPMKSVSAAMSNWKIRYEERVTEGRPRRNRGPNI